MEPMKTLENDGDVGAFLDSIPDEQKRNDSYKIMEWMSEITQKPAKMWGGSIIGFGNYHYKYASGREGDWFVLGLSPRKQQISLYLSGCENFEKHKDLLDKLGKHKTGVGCLYIKKLSDVNSDVLRELMKRTTAFFDKD